MLLLQFEMSKYLILSTCLDSLSCTLVLHDGDRGLRIMAIASDFVVVVVVVEF